MKIAFLRTLAEASGLCPVKMNDHITTTNFAISGDIAEGEIYSIATHSIFATKGGETGEERRLCRASKKSAKPHIKITTRCIVTDWAHVNDPSAVDFAHRMTRDTPIGRPPVG